MCVYAILISTLPYITIKWPTCTGRVWSARLQLISKGTRFARICFIPGLPKGGVANALPRPPALQSIA